jgi:hypothetical protein
MLEPGDEEWLADARGVDQALLPPRIRLSLPDWLFERLALDLRPESGSEFGVTLARVRQALM